MKIAKYLLLALSAWAAACSKEDPDAGLRRALLDAQIPGIYREGQALFTFDRTSQQLVPTPARRTVRIQHDDGIGYVEIRLEAMPAEGETVYVSLANNLDIDIETPRTFTLIGTEKGYLRLWSNETRTGVLIPDIRPLMRGE